MLVEFLTKLKTAAAVVKLVDIEKVAKTITLFVALVGVIETDNPVKSTNDVDVVENAFVFVVLTTCNTVPAVLLVKTVPVKAGRVSVFVPATAGAEIVTCPDVSPVRTSELMFNP